MDMLEEMFPTYPLHTWDKLAWVELGGADLRSFGGFVCWIKQECQG